MHSLTFKWDEKKNKSNKKKHNVSFEEAETSFADDKALLLHDPDHSNEEERFILLGLSSKLRILVVCHRYIKSDDVIRIISARKATRLEQEQYWERWSE